MNVSYLFVLLSKFIHNEIFYACLFYKEYLCVYIYIYIYFSTHIHKKYLYINVKFLFN